MNNVLAHFTNLITSLSLVFSLKQKHVHVPHSSAGSKIQGPCYQFHAYSFKIHGLVTN